MAIKFGTDGWRAVMGEEYTLENVRYCAQGTADYVKGRGVDRRGLVVGYDTRRGSEDFAIAVAEVAAANGVPTALADRPAPTPVVSYNLVARDAAGGAVITASHNPPQWNGYKYKPDYGGSASPEVVAELEAEIQRAEAAGRAVRMPLADAERQGLLERFDPEPTYLNHVASLVDLAGIRGSGLRVAVDSMHGAGAGYLSKLLAGGKCEVTELRADPNPEFPGMSQPEPLAHNLSELMATVAAGAADVGLATDGDADRLGVVDETGRFLTTLQTFALLCFYQLEFLGERGPLVRSITMTSMIDRLGEIYGVPVVVTPVGFKYLGPVMMSQDALAAGEESGGYGFRGNIPERDGILSGLLLLEMLAKTETPLSDLVDLLAEKVGPHHYDRWDLEFEEEERQEIVENLSSAHPPDVAGRRVEEIDTQDGFRFVLEGGYWSLVRFSGTEPLLRVYAEGESPEEVEELLRETQSLAGL